MGRQIEAIGHRGARGLFPENTLEGFLQARALGVRWFELDVGLTADGVPVVTHDLRLNPAIARDAAGRWLDGPGPAIHALTLAELERFDVGRIRPRSAYRLLFRRQQGQDGIRVPTLDRVLRALPDASFIVELKTDPRFPDLTAEPVQMADAALAVIDAAGATGRVIVESFDWRGPRHIARTRPDIALAWPTRAETVRAAALWWDGETPARHANSVPAAVAAQSPATTWAPAHGTLTRRLVAEAHGLGLRVLPWTVNRRRAMRRLFGWGVDGAITDRPDMAMAAIAAISRPPVLGA